MLNNTKLVDWLLASTGFLFVVFSVMDLARFPYRMDGLKYIALIGLALMLVLKQKRFSGDVVAIGAFVFFIMAVVLFTILNSPDGTSLLVIGSYLLCLLIYCLVAASSHVFYESLRFFATISATLFFFVNVPFVLNPEAYTLHKSQFSGALENPNAFAGLCGFFLVFFMAGLFRRLNKSQFVMTFAMTGGFALMLVLAFSRSAFVAVFIALLFFPVKMQRKVQIGIVSSFAVMFVLFVRAELVSDYVVMQNRSLLEDTGRGQILSTYIQEISSRFFLIGTGVSEAGGRIKSELSYLDIMLLSGFGSLGFFLFLGRAVALLIATKRKASSQVVWAGPLFIYVIFISIFEGYAANVVSIPSLSLYLLAAIIFSENKRFASANHANQ